MNSPLNQTQIVEDSKVLDKIESNYLKLHEAYVENHKITKCLLETLEDFREEYRDMRSEAFALPRIESEIRSMKTRMIAIGITLVVLELGLLLIGIFK